MQNNFAIIVPRKIKKQNLQHERRDIEKDPSRGRKENEKQKMGAGGVAVGLLSGRRGNSLNFF